MATPAEKLQPQTLGAKIDALHALREQKRELETEVKALNDQMKGLEADIMSQLDDQETLMSRGRAAQVTVTEQVVGTVQDWDAFYEYIVDNDAFHLLQRRVANAAYREMVEAGDEIPGTEPFTKRSLSLRKI